MPPTRREILVSTLPLTVGLAGCANSSAPSTESDDLDADESRSDGATQYPATQQPRNPDQESVFVSADDADGSSTRLRRTLLTSQSEADALAFADGVPEDHVESTRAFFAATDFDAESVYVTHVGIESCTQFRVQSVSWEHERVEYDYCRELRPPKDDCVADRREQMALCIRLPEPVSMDLSGGGSSGRNPCRNSDTEYETIDPNATDPNASNSNTAEPNASDPNASTDEPAGDRSDYTDSEDDETEADE